MKNRMQDRQSRLDYIRAKNSRQDMIWEADMALKAWASQHDNDSREIYRETRYVSILGKLFKSANKSILAADPVFMYEPEYLQLLDDYIQTLPKRDISILVNNYRTHFEGKKKAWSLQWCIRESSYRKLLNRAREHVIEFIFI